MFFMNLMVLLFVAAFRSRAELIVKSFLVGVLGISWSFTCGVKRSHFYMLSFVISLMSFVGYAFISIILL